MGHKNVNKFSTAVLSMSNCSARSMTPLLSKDFRERFMAQIIKDDTCVIIDLLEMITEMTHV